MPHHYFNFDYNGFIHSRLWYVAHPGRASKLIVFVHGFGGRAEKTWIEFNQSADSRPWWNDADLLFLGHPSTKIDPLATANRLATLLPRIYPQLPELTLVDDGAAARETNVYKELILVGHSLGGVIVRRAILKLAERFRAADSSALPHALRDARVRLFAPATGGVSSAGNLRTAMDVVKGIDRWLWRSRAYQMLRDKDSELLAGTLELRTELANSGMQFSGLSATNLWSDSDDVVAAVSPKGDADLWGLSGLSHKAICKPNATYQDPWIFVETGLVPESEILITQ